VIMIFKIRNAKDELSIQSELVWIMFFWIFFSLGYFGTVLPQIKDFFIKVD